MAEQEKKEADARRRARPLREELGAVFAYPFTDTMAYVILAVVVFVFGLAASIAAMGAFVGVLMSQGLLYAYAFTALNRVSAGEMKGFMPNISDITDLIAPFRVGLAAMIVSSAPMFLLLLFFPVAALMEGTTEKASPPPVQVEQTLASPGAAASSVDDEGVEEGTVAVEGKPGQVDFEKLRAEMQAAEPYEPAPAVPLWILPLLGLTVVWKVAYSPVALIAGGISRSFLSTLNPVTGILAIRRMGAVYWEAMVVYTVLAVSEVVIGLALGWIPVAGRLVHSFVQGYVYLVVGCLLGLAVFKKAPELGLE